MKNLTGLIAFAGVILFLTPSCMKEKRPDKMVTQTINVTIHKYDTYKFILPENTSDDEFQITEQASHYSISKLEENSASQIIYTYKPADEYVGKDRVVIANVEEDHQGSGNNCGGGSQHGMGGGSHGNNHNCSSNNHHDEIEQTIIINFNVLDTIVGKHQEYIGARIK